MRMLGDQPTEEGVQRAGTHPGLPAGQRSVEGGNETVDVPAVRAVMLTRGAQATRARSRSISRSR
jgi:hypothetical protein